MNAYPVEIRGITYPSASAAARELGVAASTVRCALENGNTDGVGLGRNWSRKIPCTVDGVEYESRSDAARAVDIPCRTFNIHCWKKRKAGKREFTWRGHKVVLHDE